MACIRKIEKITFLKGQIKLKPPRYKWNPYYVHMYHVIILIGINKIKWMHQNEKKGHNTLYDHGYI